MKLRSRSFAVVASLASVLASNAWCAEILDLYTGQPSLNIAITRGIDLLTKQIKEQSGGEVEIRMHLAKTLQIDPNNITDAVAANVIEMGDDLFFSGNVPLGAVLRLPFLIGKNENVPIAHKATLPAVEKAFAAKGVTVLGGYIAPPQYLWTQKVVKDLAGIEGLKIRVNSPEQAEFIKRMGGIPLTIPSPDVAAALQQGVVDGLLTAAVGGGRIYRETLHSGYMIPVNYNNGYLIINTSAFESLPPQQRQLVRELGASTAQWITDTFFAEDQVIIDSLEKDADFTITYPSDAEMTKATGELSSYWVEWADRNGEDAKRLLAEVETVLGK